MMRTDDSHGAFFKTKLATRTLSQRVVKMIVPFLIVVFVRPHFIASRAVFQSVAAHLQKLPEIAQDYCCNQIRMSDFLRRNSSFHNNVETAERDRRPKLISSLGQSSLLYDVDPASICDSST